MKRKGLKVKVKDNIKTNEKNEKIEKIINWIIIFLFIILCMLVGKFHEPWSDEAQSWLIARDQSVKEIIFYNSRYEGTFPLWFLTLKLFINLGLSYNYIYIVSILISAIGISILMNKTKLPKKIKYLLPFGFYVLYQYTVIARSYCYMILAFAILITIYEKRHEKIIKYFLNLILFSMISLHGMIISGILMLCYFIESIKEYKINKKISKTKFTGFIIIAIVYFFEIYILIPPTDILVDANYSKNIIETILDIFLKIITYKENNFCIIINSIIFAFWVIIIQKNNKEKKYDFLLIEISMLILFLMVRAAPHHIGILFLILVTKTLLINNKESIDLLSICLILYVILTIASTSQDIIRNYSGAKEMANYINNELEDYENKRIYAIGYKSVALLPYFENNIYYNRDECYYLWSTQNIEWLIYRYVPMIDIEKVEFENEEMPEYILLEYHDLSDTDKEIQKIIEKNVSYELLYYTEGYNFFKGNYSETEGYYLYKLKENI